MSKTITNYHKKKFIKQKMISANLANISLRFELSHNIDNPNTTLGGWTHIAFVKLFPQKKKKKAKTTVKKIDEPGH